MLTYIANDCLITIFQFLSLYELIYGCPTINRFFYSFIQTHEQVWQYVILPIKLRYDCFDQSLNYCNFNEKSITKLIQTKPFLRNVRIELIAQKDDPSQFNECSSIISCTYILELILNSFRSLNFLYLKGDNNFKLTDQFLDCLYENRHLIDTICMDKFCFHEMNGQKISLIQPLSKVSCYHDLSVLPKQLISYDQNQFLRLDEFIFWQEMCFKRISTLVEVHIPCVYTCYKNEKDLYVEALVRIIKKLSNIRVLKFSAFECKNTSSIFKALSETCGFLQELHLERVWCDENDINCLKKLPQLTTIHFKPCILPKNSAVYQALSSMPQVTHLNIGKISLPDTLSLFKSIKGIEFTPSIVYIHTNEHLFAHIINVTYFSDLTRVDLSEFRQTYSIVQVIEQCYQLHTIKLQKINKCITKALCIKPSRWKCIEIQHDHPYYFNQIFRPYDAYQILQQCNKLEILTLTNFYLFGFPFVYTDMYSIHQVRLQFQNFMNKHIESLPKLIRWFSSTNSQLKKITWNQVNQ